MQSHHIQSHSQALVILVTWSHCPLLLELSPLCLRHVWITFDETMAENRIEKKPVYISAFIYRLAPGCKFLSLLLNWTDCVVCCCRHVCSSCGWTNRHIDWCQHVGNMRMACCHLLSQPSFCQTPIWFCKWASHAADRSAASLGCISSPFHNAFIRPWVWKVLSQVMRAACVRPRRQWWLPCWLFLGCCLMRGTHYSPTCCRRCDGLQHGNHDTNDTNNDK